MQLDKRTDRQISGRSTGRQMEDVSGHMQQKRHVMRAEKGERSESLPLYLSIEVNGER